MISFSREQLFLVTGASSGIGRATALLLVSLGASVVAVGRDEQRLRETRDASAAPDAFHLYPRELLEDLQGIGAWVRGIREDHGKFSGLFSCAGAMYMDSLRDYNYENAQRTFSLHFHVPILLAQAIADRRNCIGAGTSLVFVSALGGVVPQAGLLTYGAAKAALISAAKNLSKELGKRKIRVNTISPALVKTPLTTKDYADFMGYDPLAVEAPQYPLGIGEPEEVAQAGIFLLSARASWITGQNIVLDGGRY